MSASCKLETYSWVVDSHQRKGRVAPKTRRCHHGLQLVDLVSCEGSVRGNGEEKPETVRRVSACTCHRVECSVETHLLARCGLLTTIRPHTSQSVGTSQSFDPHRGHMYPPRFTRPWHAQKLSPAPGRRVGKPITMRSPAGGGRFPGPAAVDFRPPRASASCTLRVVGAAIVWAGGGTISHNSYL